MPMPSALMGESPFGGWSLGAAFRQSVFTRASNDAWELQPCIDMCAGESMEAALAAVTRSVEGAERAGRSWYVGITECPPRRFAEHWDTRGVSWESATVLVKAASSSTTAALERSVLASFGDHPHCCNSGAGGERASAGEPHYLYLLVGSSGLLRRST